MNSSLPLSNISFRLVLNSANRNVLLIEKKNASNVKKSCLNIIFLRWSLTGVAGRRAPKVVNKFNDFFLSGLSEPFSVLRKLRRTFQLQNNLFSGQPNNRQTTLVAFVRLFVFDVSEFDHVVTKHLISQLEAYS